MSFVNLALMRNPANWLIVFLMLAVGALGLFYIADKAGVDIPS